MKKYYKLPSKYIDDEWLEYYHDQSQVGYKVSPIGAHTNRKQKQTRIPVSEDVTGEDTYFGKYFKAFELSPEEADDPKKLNLGLYLTDTHFNWDYFFDSLESVIHPVTDTKMYVNNNSVFIYSADSSFTTNYFWKKYCGDNVTIFLGMYSRYKSYTNCEYKLDLPDTTYNYRYGKLNPQSYCLYYNCDENNDGLTGDNEIAVNNYYDQTYYYTDYCDCYGRLRMRVRVNISTSDQELFIYYTDPTVTEPVVCAYLQYKSGWNYSLNRYKSQEDGHDAKLFSMSMSSLGSVTTIKSRMDFLVPDGANVSKVNQEVYPGSNSYHDTIYMGGGSSASLVPDTKLVKAINFIKN